MCCDDQPVIALAASDQDNLSGLIEDYIREIFQDREVSPKNQEKLWKHYYNTLAKGVNIGYNPEPEHFDTALAHSLKKNVARFSAFKESSFRKQLEASLTDKGRLLPWNEFKKTAAALNADYNKRWLQAEYNQTVASANMAQTWQEFQRNADLYPNVRFHTAGDGRVRDAHRVYDGLVLPIGHSFWNKLPPLDWGCRCWLSQTDDAVSSYVPQQPVKPGFDNNPAKSGRILDEHIYRDGLGSAADQAEKDAEKYFKNHARPENNAAVYESYKSNKAYTDVALDTQSGGMKATHKLHGFDKVKGHLEKQARDLLFKNGHQIILEKELAAKGEKVIDGVKKIDGFLDGAAADISSIVGTGNNTIKRALNHSRQKWAKVAILYFPSAEDFSFARLKKGVAMYQGQTEYRFDKIVYIVEGVAREYK